MQAGRCNQVANHARKRKEAREHAAHAPRHRGHQAQREQRRSRLLRRSAGVGVQRRLGVADLVDHLGVGDRVWQRARGGGRSRACGGEVVQGLQRHARRACLRDEQREYAQAKERAAVCEERAPAGRNVIGCQVEALLRAAAKGTAALGVLGRARHDVGQQRAACEARELAEGVPRCEERVGQGLSAQWRGWRGGEGPRQCLVPTVLLLLPWWLERLLLPLLGWSD